ncbi:MAG: DUF362 domain-containing protein [Bacteroidetes bacterium]|nr:DUF362 domain-containing protein [Bacteroidota bacterium]
MKSLFRSYVQICPNTGRIRGLNIPKKSWQYVFIPFIGFIAFIWILFRVIQKPSRLSYPCVQTALPFASGFLAYLLTFVVSLVTFLRSRKALRFYPIFFTGTFIVVSFMGFYLAHQNVVTLEKNVVVNPNEPIGEAQGIYPGRVVWVHDPNATNENCSPTTYGDGWFLPKNNNQAVVDRMLSRSLQVLTGQTTDSAAWDALFRYHNSKRGRGNIPYTTGEKIFIKINIVSAWNGNFNTTDLSKVNNSYYGVVETSPAIVMAVLRQLVNVVKVRQQDIYVGDPMRHVYKHMYDYLRTEFPNIHYLDYSYSTLGRELALKGQARIYYSDNDTVLRPNVWGDPWHGPDGTGSIYHDYLYAIFDSAKYLINIPALKGHKRAGMTLFAKNHFGSHTRADASHLHNGLVAPHEMERGITRSGYKRYRVQVDFMAHSLLGKKNLVYILDALWATDHELGTPQKWQMPPFNNDYTSSLFASLDPVAIESVGYDFLRSEFTIQRTPQAGTYVQMEGVDDYLHQAADSSNWPVGIRYDPDSCGQYFKSLGVHEHWNNANEKKYSRNLQPNGMGIELVKIDPTTSVAMDPLIQPEQFFILTSNYPNPFNPSTTIQYRLTHPASVTIDVYDIRGRHVSTIMNGLKTAGTYTADFDGTSHASGMYIVRCIAKRSEGEVIQTAMKIMLIK